jgi:hypothetical protein
MFRTLVGVISRVCLRIEDSIVVGRCMRSMVPNMRAEHVEKVEHALMRATFPVPQGDKFYDGK